MYGRRRRGGRRARRARPAAVAPARRRGAPRRGRVRARGVPALLGRAVAELAGTRPHDLGPRSARRPHARARLRPRAAEHRRGAGRRARAGHRLVARRDRDGPRQRRAQRGRAGDARLLVDGARPADRARPVGPRARVRRPLRGPQRATRCSSCSRAWAARSGSPIPAGCRPRASWSGPRPTGRSPHGRSRRSPTAPCTGCVSRWRRRARACWCRRAGAAGGASCRRRTASRPGAARGSCRPRRPRAPRGRRRP